MKDDVKNKETIEIIIEDPFYERLVSEFQNELSNIILLCISHKYQEVIDFFKFLMEGLKGLEKDNAERFKAMLWFAVLLTDLLSTDAERICEKGSDYLKTKLKELLDYALNEKIMLPDKETEENDYDTGMWNETVFVLLQGKDRKKFVEYLKGRFNFDNKDEHSNRLLLARHRSCMYQKAIQIFCKERTE